MILRATILCLESSHISDWCLRSNHPLEFPHSDVVVEDWTSHRYGQLCCDQDGGADSSVSPRSRQTDQGGWIPTWRHQRPLWIRESRWRSYFVTHGHRQSGLYRFHHRWPTDHEGCGFVQPEEDHARAGWQESQHCVRRCRYRQCYFLGQLWHLLQPWPVLLCRVTNLRARRHLRQVHPALQGAGRE